MAGFSNRPELRRYLTQYLSDMQAQIERIRAEEKDPDVRDALDDLKVHVTRGIHHVEGDCRLREVFYKIRATPDNGDAPYYVYEGMEFTDCEHAEREREGAARVHRNIAFDVCRFSR